MEVRMDRDRLLNSVSRVQSIIEKRSNMPILSTVLLTATGSEIVLSATDLELGFQQRLTADVVEEGSIAVSGRKLFEILKESNKSSFHLKEKENNWIYLSDGLARFNLACLPADDYPAITTPENVTCMDADGSVLSEMISKTIYAVTMEEAGFKLSGVFVEKVAQEGKTVLRMVATDGHRLSMVDKSLPGVDELELGTGVMIPKKGMSELNKLAAEGGPVKLGFKQNNCLATRQDTLLITARLFHGRRKAASTSTASPFRRP
jgi:DNA polymerase-3 subunit beta